VKRIVVAGAGLAGHEAVRRLLADPAFDGTITWHAGEPGHPYNRVLLTDLLARRHAPSVIELPTLSDPRLTYQARPLRSIAKAEFDHLVLATGAEPVIPPVRGNAVALRTVADVQTILGELDGRGGGKRIGRIAVVGGGPLGVETACALASRGAKVELLHRGAHLLSHWLDAESADLLAGSLTAAGITVHCDTEVSAATGTWPKADLVILACGVQPRVALARAAGLPIATGILVDTFGRSLGDERIFAVGDCAEAPGTRRQPGALAAMEAARQAVAAVTGAPVTATTPVNAPLRLRTYGIPGADVAVLGRPHPEPSIQFTDQRRRTRKTLTLDGDLPVAAALVGDVKAAAALALAIARPTTPAPQLPAALLTSPPSASPLLTSPLLTSATRNGAAGFGEA
jgi:assimilatory nitrate reductase electron transfer subunit